VWPANEFNILIRVFWSCCSPFKGVGIDPEQIRHQFGGIPIGAPEMLRCAKGFGLKGRRCA